MKEMIVGLIYMAGPHQWHVYSSRLTYYELSEKLRTRRRDQSENIKK